MRNLLLVTMAAIALLGPVLACVPQPQQSPAAAPATGPGVSSPGPARESWEAEWEKVLAAGKKEGMVSVYTSWTPDIRVALRETFEKKYGISLEFTTASGGPELTAKMERERTAGLYLADVIGNALSVVTTLMRPIGLAAPIEPMLVLPEARDTKVRVGGLLFLDADQKYFIPLAASFDSFLSRNTDLVKEGEIKSFRDILDPKWRGKIIMNDPTGVGGGNAFVTLTARLWGWEQARAYLNELVRQAPVLSRDYRLQAEWVARGKMALGVGVPINQLMIFQKMGAPVALVRAKEGGRVSQGGPGGLILPAGKLPHPNATRVFINWMLTREGQTVFSKAFLQPAWRLDVSTEGLEELVPPPGATVEDEETAKLQAQYRETAKEVFAPLLK
ncbi:MAG: ABC transporter substrate-binding protein [Chloroflexi bacterium]|nr:ABC transporter substrate-binding protein [Chloroflexota bacterium]